MESRNSEWLKRLSIVDMSMDRSLEIDSEANSSYASSEDDSGHLDDDVPNHIKEESRSPPRELFLESGLPSPDTKHETPVSAEIDAYNRILAEAGVPTSESSSAIVVLAPESYKHVFSRPWVSKSYLSSVVERPERLNAVAIGVGASRSVCSFEVVESRKRTPLYSPHFEKVHGKDWATELYALCNQAASKHARDENEVPESWPAGDIYLVEGTLAALEGAIGAMECAIDAIFRPSGAAKRAFVGVRPPGHHCHEEAASGFCVMNNAHIAIQYAHAEHDVTHAVILDFDLHHGDGSQDLLWKLGFRAEGPAEISMGYFSVHDINSFPCERGYADPEKLSAASVCLVAHDTAVWNVHLQPYETAEEFDKLYESTYSELFKRAAQFLSASKREHRSDKPFKPLVVISAGFDGSEYEGQGMQRHHVHVPTSFFNRFTRDSVALADHYGEGHVLSLLEGGYSSSAIATGVFSHITALCGEPGRKEWFSKDAAKELDRATRSRWKSVSKSCTLWPSADLGIRLGRALIPGRNVSPEPAGEEPRRLQRSNRHAPYASPPPPGPPLS